MSNTNPYYYYNQQSQYIPYYQSQGLAPSNDVSIQSQHVQQQVQQQQQQQQSQAQLLHQQQQHQQQQQAQQQQHVFFQQQAQQEHQFQQAQQSSNTPMRLRRGPWSPSEDKRLLELVSMFGGEKNLNWVKISQMLETRTAKQARERYHQNLKPTLNRTPITAEEGKLIEELVEKHGKRWAEIARHLNGRSDNAIKNWWNGGANRRKRANSKSSKNKNININSTNKNDLIDDDDNENDLEIYNKDQNGDNNYDFNNTNTNTNTNTNIIPNGDEHNKDMNINLNINKSSSSSLSSPPNSAVINHLSSDNSAASTLGFNGHRRHSLYDIPQVNLSSYPSTNLPSNNYHHSPLMPPPNFPLHVQSHSAIGAPVNVNDQLSKINNSGNSLNGLAAAVVVATTGPSPPSKVLPNNETNTKRHLRSDNNNDNLTPKRRHSAASLPGYPSLSPRQYPASTHLLTPLTSIHPIKNPSRTSSIGSFEMASSNSTSNSNPGSITGSRRGSLWTTGSQSMGLRRGSLGFVPLSNSRRASMASGPFTNVTSLTQYSISNANSGASDTSAAAAAAAAASTTTTTTTNNNNNNELRHSSISGNLNNAITTNSNTTNSNDVNNGLRRDLFKKGFSFDKKMPSEQASDNQQEERVEKEKMSISSLVS